MKKVLFICSSGGHLNEMMQLLPLFSQYDALLVREQSKYTVDFAVREKFLLKGSRQNLLRYLFVFFWNCIKSYCYFLQFKPDVVVTTGAHTAVPMCYIAKFHHKRVIFLESIARVQSKSLTGKLIEKKCDIIFVQWENMLTVYENAQYVGRIL